MRALVVLGVELASGQTGEEEGPGGLHGGACLEPGGRGGGP